MRNLIKIGLCALLFCISIQSFAQESNTYPVGTVIYSLPSTSISLIVEAVKESFTAGPYAQYAQKYLGTQARTEDAVTYQLSSIQVVPYLEADASIRIPINLSGKNVSSANFLKFCSQGLIVTSDSYTGKPESWRFPSIATNDQFAGKGVEGNLTSTTTTLYKTVTTENGFQRVAVPQNQVVEKSTEKKAEEIAQSIFALRKQRLQIITGDTDATFSGEALGSAINEINRLEEEYLSLFLGHSESSSQKMNFDVVPKADNAKHLYVAFRISENLGLLPANNMSGRPIVLELTLESESASQSVPISTALPKSKEAQQIYYRVPAIATAKILDGQSMLLQTRIPVYQLGAIRAFPIETMINK